MNTPITIRKHYAKTAGRLHTTVQEYITHELTVYVTEPVFADAKERDEGEYSEQDITKMVIRSLRTLGLESDVDYQGSERETEKI